MQQKKQRDQRANDDIARGNTGTGDQDRRDVSPHDKVDASTGLKERDEERPER